MIRRDFLKYAISSLAAPFISNEIKAEEIQPAKKVFIPKPFSSCLGYGKYQSHLLTAHYRDSNDDLYMLGNKLPYHRMLNFPIEGILKIRFEKATEFYYCWNCDVYDLDYINGLSAESLYFYYHRSSYTYSEMKEIDRFDNIFKIGSGRLKERKLEFRLSKIVDEN